MSNNLGRHIEPGEVVVIDKRYHNKNFRKLEQRLFIARGGFGMEEYTMGRAVFGEYVCDGEQCRREGYEINRAETEKYQAKFGKFAHKPRPEKRDYPEQTEQAPTPATAENLNRAVDALHAINEEEITKSIAKSMHFEKLWTGKWYVCELCGKRFSVHYIGQPINERMIQHYNTFHKRP